MLYAINVDVALVDSRGSWLLIRRSAGEKHAAGQLSLVGGTVDTTEPGSDVLESTARREVLEEVGLQVTGPLTFVESTYFDSDDGDRVINVVFAARVPDLDIAVVAAPGEVAELVRVMSAELGSLDAPPWTRQSLYRAAAALRRAAI